jgi:EmrB/QacA subfamily drug resistance transporter
MQSAHAAPTVIAPRLRANPWIVLIVLTLGYFMILLDTTIVNVALPDMERDLGASFDQILWVVNGYVLVFAVLLITAGRLGDLLGPKSLFIGGLALFTLASAACGLAQDAGQLILFRGLQGIGAASMTPQTLAILTTILPPERRGAAFGVLGSVAGLAVVVGPTLGGWLVTAYRWQAIFYVNIPVGIAAILAALFLVPEIRSHRAPGLDLPGVALASGGLLALVFALIESQKYAWGPITDFGAFSLGASHWSVISVYSLLVYAVALLVLFVWWETRAAQPLLPLSLFGDRNFAAANLVASVISFPFAMFVVLTIFLQSVLGQSAIQAGLTMIPTSLALMVASPLAGRLSDRINGKYTLLAGLLAATLGIGLTAWTLALGTSSWDLAIPLAVTGLGMGFVFAPLNTLAMRDVKPALAGAASGLLFTNRQVGQVMGSAVVGSVLANGVASDLPRQALHVAGQVALPWRGRFVAGFERASHGAQNFGAGQSFDAILPRGTSQAVVQHLAALSHQAFGQAFVNAARPSIALCSGVVLLAALFAGGLRGGRSAADARRVEARSIGDVAA